LGAATPIDLRFSFQFNMANPVTGLDYEVYTTVRKGSRAADQSGTRLASEPRRAYKIHRWISPGRGATVRGRRRGGNRAQVRAGTRAG